MDQNQRKFSGLIFLVLALLACLNSFDFALAQETQTPQERLAALNQVINSPAFVSRRARLMESCRDTIILIPSQYMTRQGIRDNLNFYYLTGLEEPGAVLLLDPTGPLREILFRPTLTGPRTMGPANAAKNYPNPTEPGELADSSIPPQNQSESTVAIKPAEELTSFLRQLSFRTRRVHLPFSDLDFLGRTFSLVNPFSQGEAIFNVDPLLLEMRLTKDAEEIQFLREAIDLTAEALREAFRAAEPGVREIDLAAILKYAFNRRETKESFLQVASGPNSTNIHFGATSRPLAPGDLIVIDVGAYIKRYTSDITRTIPASGRFTKEQRQLYELVLQAQKEGCRRLVAGVTFKAVQDEVEKILLAGLEKLGLVTDVNSSWQRRLYIQHGFGHGIGLDVHDAWSWHSPRLDKVVMAPGMVMTMEPGLYFPEKRLETYLASLKGKVPEDELEAFRSQVAPVYARYAGMGVRIEDDILITAEGNEILSARVPKEVADIEKLMREKSVHNLIIK